MRIVILMAIFSSVVEAQSIVTSGDGQSIVFSSKLKAMAFAVDTKSDETKTRPVVLPPQPAEAIDRDYVLIVKVPHCGPCIPMVEKEVPRIRNRGIQVVVVDSDNLPEGMVWRHNTGPGVYIIDGKTRKSRKHWVGYTSANVVLDEFPFPIGTIGEPISSCAPDCNCSSACTCGCQSGEPCECGRAKASTPASRTQTEIDAEKHLREVHGIDASGKSLVEMEVIHDAAHGGTGYHFPGRSSMSASRSSSNCPGGVCPTRSRQLSRRR